MTEQAPDRIWSGIDIPKTIAGALAAICAAVAGSFLGVAGTLAGAAVASIIGSVGTEIYARSIKKGTDKLQTLAPAFVKAPAAVGTPEVAAATEEDLPSHTVPEAQRGGIRWGRVAAIAGAVFVLAIAGLSLYEAFAHKSLAAQLTGQSTSGSSTVGSLLKGSDDSGAPAATPSESATPSADPTSSGSAETPAGTPAGTSSTTDPGSTPATSTPANEAPTTAPADETPEQTPPTDTQDQQLDSGPQDTTE